MRYSVASLSVVAALTLAPAIALADGNGAVAGAAGGAVAGAVVGGPVGAVVGGAGGAIVGGAASGPQDTNTTVVHENVDAPVPTCTTSTSKQTSYGINGAETTRTTASNCP